MQRNMNKIIKEVKLNPAFDMTCDETKAMMTENNSFYIVNKSFRYGYAMGRRAYASEMKVKSHE